jgi:aminoglycoside phosphotransferase (APT) family kinase protein
LLFPGSERDAAAAIKSRATLAVALDSVRQRFADEYPDLLSTIGAQTLSFSSPGWLRSRQAANATLLHGDFHPEQLFFPTEDGGRFAVFDWQSVRAGSGGDDLARMIVHGLDADQRERFDLELIALYHSQLLGAGVEGYSLAQCREDFRFGLVTTVNLTTVALTSMDDAILERDRAKGIDELDWVRPVAAAAEAHRVVDVLG